MDRMIDLLRRGLEDQGCFVRPMQYTNEDDSGALRVTTDDDRVFSVHFHLEGQAMDRCPKFGWHIDASLPPGTIEVWQDGKRIGRIENIGSR